MRHQITARAEGRAIRYGLDVDGLIARVPKQPRVNTIKVAGGFRVILGKSPGETRRIVDIEVPDTITGFGPLRSAQ